MARNKESARLWLDEVSAEECNEVGEDGYLPLTEREIEVMLDDEFMD